MRREFGGGAFFAQIFAVLGFLGSFIFTPMLAVPIAFFFGFGMLTGYQRARHVSMGTIPFLFWSGFWIGIGSILSWGYYYLHGDFPFFAHAKWIGLGPFMTMAVYIGGGALYLAVCASRQRRDRGADATPPAPGDQGSSTQHRKHNPTNSERREGLKLIASVQL